MSNYDPTLNSTEGESIQKYQLNFMKMLFVYHFSE